MLQRIYPDKERKLLIKMLKDLSVVLEAIQVTWSISAGILLGAVRTGEFIPWDYDVDICVHSLDKLQEIYDGMLKYGYGGSLHQYGKYGKGNDH